MITTTELAVGSLAPNSFNPNEMTIDAFKELKAEMARLKRVPKPVVVRRLSSPASGDEEQFEIVDGAHSWQAAREVGLEMVSCEIIEADDYEAMTQCYKRNQHGVHNRVLEGRMFLSMMTLRGLSQRRLARDLGISDGSVRNSLEYARAAELRKPYAASLSVDEDEVVDSIGDLTLRQVKNYLRLPAEFRDRWLDEGGMFFRKFHILAASQIVEFGLEEFISPHVQFYISLSRLSPYCRWVASRKDVEAATAYSRELLARRMPAELLDQLPIDPETGEILMPIDKWKQAVNETRYESIRSQRSHLAHACDRVLEALGRDPDDLRRFGESELEDKLTSAPDVLRDCGALTLAEKADLQSRRLRNDQDDPSALRMTLEYFERVRATGGSETATPVEIYVDVLFSTGRQRRAAKESQLFASRSAMLEELAARLKANDELLARLEQLSDAELSLATAAALGGEAIENPLSRWRGVVETGELPAAIDPATVTCPKPEETRTYALIKQLRISEGLE